MKTYLVTGGAGFLGSALVRRLIREGNRVRVFDNQSRGRIDRLGDVADSIEYVSGDIRIPAEVETVVKGIDRSAISRSSTERNSFTRSRS